MAGITHLALALTSKRFAPKVSLWALIFCSYLIDILFLVYMIGGIEHLPLPNNEGSVAGWSHSLFMAFIYSILTIIIVHRTGQDQRTSLILGLLVFSHFIIDMIAQPMTYLFPNSTSPPLHPFHGAPLLGLGVWNTEMGVILGEFGSLFIGIVVYLLVWRQLHNIHQPPTIKTNLQNIQPNASVINSNK